MCDESNTGELCSLGLLQNQEKHEVTLQKEGIALNAFIVEC